MIVAREVTKFYGRHQALSKVSFEVQPGEVVGLIGPNGAGKTTLLSVLMGFLRIQSGEVQVLGKAVICGRSPVGAFLVADHPTFYGFLSARKQLYSAGRLMGREPDRKSVEEILERVGLRQDADRKISEFSRGMAQRMAWAVALLAQPAALLMDERTSALDPGGVIQLRTVVEEFAEAGAAVLFSSHTLPEVERLCGRVLFLKHGELTTASDNDFYASGSLTALLMLFPLLVCAGIVASEVESGRALLIHSFGISRKSFIFCRILGAAAFCFLVTAAIQFVL